LIKIKIKHSKPHNPENLIVANTMSELMLSQLEKRFFHMQRRKVFSIKDKTEKPFSTLLFNVGGSKIYH
jgi:hypothetical protein